jgi:hypothetical protein
MFSSATFQNFPVVSVRKKIVLKSAKIFQKFGNHLNVLVAGRMTLGNLHTEDSQILDNTVRILVATATGLRDLCSPGNTHSRHLEKLISRIQISRVRTPE